MRFASTYMCIVPRCALSRYAQLALKIYGKKIAARITSLISVLRPSFMQAILCFILSVRLNLPVIRYFRKNFRMNSMPRWKKIELRKIHAMRYINVLVASHCITAYHNSGLEIFGMKIENA